MACQVGSFGQTVAPKLHLALGVSGAIQHIICMKGADVAVGNLFDIVPTLIEEMKRKGSADNGTGHRS